LAESGAPHQIAPRALAEVALVDALREMVLVRHSPPLRPPVQADLARDDVGVEEPARLEDARHLRQEHGWIAEVLVHAAREHGVSVAHGTYASPAAPQSFWRLSAWDLSGNGVSERHGLVESAGAQVADLRHHRDLVRTLARAEWCSLQGGNWDDNVARTRVAGSIGRYGPDLNKAARERDCWPAGQENPIGRFGPCAPQRQVDG